jgi:glycerate dehydrogenase
MSKAEIAVTNKVVLEAEVLEKLPDLRFIAVTATGYNVVDVEAAGKRGIPVSNVPGYATDSVAEHTLALLFELARRPAVHDLAVRSGEWDETGDFCFWKTPQRLLKGKTLGIVGLGDIGTRVGELATSFGMKVIAYKPRPGEAPRWPGFEWKSLEDLFAEADAVTLHCPLTADNAEFVDRNLLRRMKKEAFFLNTARGGLVNEQDLALALNTGGLAGAAVDVVSQEPIREDNPLLNARNCLITPHLAWAALAAREELMHRTAENIRAFLEGSPVNVVNSAYLNGK